MYRIARQLQAPGVKTVATFNPTRLTKSLRNMVRKSIASGIHNGGWSSKTKKVRNLVFDLASQRPETYVVTDSNYMVLRTPRPITADNQSEIIGLLEADCTLQKMDYDTMEKTRWTPTREDHYRTIDNRHKQHVEYVKAAHVNAYTLVVIQSNIRKQIADVFLRERTPAEIAFAEMLASRLDANEEFLVPIDHNF